MKHVAIKAAEVIFGFDCTFKGNRVMNEIIKLLILMFLVLKSPQIPLKDERDETQDQLNP